MIDYSESIIVLDGKIEPVKHFEVWFRTPTGLYSKLDKAQEDCEKHEWNPNTVIAPVCVAVGSTIYEELNR